MELEGRVLLGQLVEGLGEPLLLRFRLGLDRRGEDRLGELDLLQDDRIVENSVLNFNGKYRGLANMYSLSLGYAF